jgi:hypothetical protein
MKNKFKILIIYLGILIIPTKAFAYFNNEKEFIVILFEWTGQKIKEKTVYYWILPLDHNLEKIKIYPLVFSDISSFDNYKKCEKGEQIDLYTYTSETNFDYSEDYLFQETKLKRLILKNKRLIQEVIINRRNGIFKKEKIQISITPLNGDFFTCNQVHIEHGTNKVEICGKVFFPGLSSKLNLDFWNTEFAQTLTNSDFFEFNFENHLPKSKRMRMSGTISKSISDF